LARLISHAIRGLWDYIIRLKDAIFAPIGYKHFTVLCF
jgi:hypothetical protein